MLYCHSSSNRLGNNQDKDAVLFSFCGVSSFPGFGVIEYMLFCDIVQCVDMAVLWSHVKANNRYRTANQWVSFLSSQQNMNQHILTGKCEAPSLLYVYSELLNILVLCANNLLNTAQRQKQRFYFHYSFPYFLPSLNLFLSSASYT